MLTVRRFLNLDTAFLFLPMVYHFTNNRCNPTREQVKHQSNMGEMPIAYRSIVGRTLKQR